MKYYNINTIFHFGKHNGKMVKEVLSIQPSYLNWCAINLDSFLISDEDLAEMRRANARFFLSSDAIEAIAKKAVEENVTSTGNYGSGYYERQTFNEYRGSYAQDEMGFSDQTINDAFEGDPDLYWNID